MPGLREAVWCENSRRPGFDSPSKYRFVRIARCGRACAGGQSECSNCSLYAAEIMLRQALYGFRGMPYAQLVIAWAKLVRVTIPSGGSGACMLPGGERSKRGGP